jgi:hydantoinase/carbamoylase family amidase
VQVDAERLRADLETLASFGRNAEGGIDRASFTPADRRARAWLAERARSAGMSYEEDPAGNVMITLDGPAASAVWVGSHIDAVPNGGMFDGALGFIAGLEGLRRLREDGVALARPVRLVAFADEEGAYVSLLGSRAVAQGLVRSDLDGVVGRDGREVVTVLDEAGIDPDGVAAARIEPGDIHAYVELHIEQGATLEQDGVDIGVVTGIVGIGRGRVVFTGRPDHAGTTPMKRRRDALRAAGAFVTRLPDAIEAASAPEAVITCGKLDVEPGALNVVPHEVTAHLDFRSLERGDLEAIEGAASSLAEECAAPFEVDAAYQRLEFVDGTPLDDGLQQLIEDTATALGFSHRRMPSGAGHDAQLMATVTAAGMLFVPSVEGRSHSPLERTEWSDVTRGANVLLGVLRALATGP